MPRSESAESERMTQALAGLSAVSTHDAVRRLGEALRRAADGVAGCQESERLDLAVQKGCDGVEPDNVDGFANNSGFNLTATDQLAFNRRIANAAHERNLAVALKNDLDQILELLDYFDFAVNEQCHEFDECDLLTPFVSAGKPVFNAEYLERFRKDSGARAAMCQETLRLGLHTLVLPVDLDDAFRFSCD